MRVVTIGRVRLALEAVVLAAVLVLLGLATCDGRRQGDARLRLAEAERQLDSLRALADRLDTLYLRDTVRLRQLVTRWDTAVVAVDRWKHDTVTVERVVTLADSTIRACTAALQTCEQRVDAARRGWRVEAARADALEALQGRPWTAAGLSYDGGVGAFVDRDVWRLRVGGSVHTTPQGPTAQVRLGWRW